MNQKEIKELIELLVEKDIAEFELERGDMKLHIKRGVAPQLAPVVQVAPAVAPLQRCPWPPAPVLIAGSGASLRPERCARQHRPPRRLMPACTS